MEALKTGTTYLLRHVREGQAIDSHPLDGGCMVLQDITLSDGSTVHNIQAYVQVPKRGMDLVVDIAANDRDHADRIWRELMNADIRIRRNVNA
jgi:hypothetical protein